MQGFPIVDNFKVVVQCITYNHSQYIEDALKGVAMQRTNFPFICCVYDDASTDGEQEILKRWIDNHCKPEDIEVYDHPLTIILMAPDKDNPNCNYAIHLQKVNTWGKPEKRRMLEYWEAKCEYVALCEGDDYWIDPLKIQNQVNVMDSDISIGLCYSRTKYLCEETKSYMYDWGGPKVNFDDLLLSNSIPTLTVMYRIGYMDAYYRDIEPDKQTWLMGDYPVWLWFAYNYKIYFIDKVTSVYRVLRESASHSIDVEKKLMFIMSFIDIQEYFADKYKVKNKMNYDIIRIQAKMYNYALYGKWNCYINNWKKLVSNNTKYLLSLFPYKYMLFFICPYLRRKYIVH